MALARQHPRLLEEARANLQAGIDKVRTADPPKPSEHWAIAASHAGIEHAGLVIVNLRDRAQHDRAQALLAELQRLRTDRQVFDDILAWRGQRTPPSPRSASTSPTPKIQAPARQSPERCGPSAAHPKHDDERNGI